MSLEDKDKDTDKDKFLKGMQLILDGVSLSTENEFRIDIGIYLMGLLVADHKGEMDDEKLAVMRELISIADEMKGPQFSFSEIAH
jgi:hypothetical protein